MHSEVADDGNDEIAATAARERRRYKFSAGLVFSVALHALAFSALILALGLAASPNESPLVVPVNIVQLGDETASPPEPNKADVSQQKAAPPSSPDTKPADLSPLKMRPPPDDLEIKLRRLAELHQPIVDQHLSEKGKGLSRVSAMRQDAAPGSEAMIKDFLRDQIEHHWSPNLATLHGRDISFLIRVAITKTGVVTKAEVVDNRSFGVDPVYDEVALSARNAALLSSPLTLPPGHYADSMDVILSLNTKDALR